MTGEMGYISQDGIDGDGECWELHAAIAKAVKGELKPFDKYQGPYIVVGADATVGRSPYTVPVQHLGCKRLWIVNDEEDNQGAIFRVWREDTDKLSEPFWWNDTEGAINQAKLLLAN